MNILKAFSLLVLVLLFNCSQNSTDISREITPITLDEIYSQKITTFVDKEINLQAKIYWYSSNLTWEGTSDTTWADLLKLKFENGDMYIDQDRFKNQERGDLFLKSVFIEKRLDTNLIEQYYFKDDSLSNLNLTYILKGKIQYRDWLNVTEQHLQDTVFINQSNNVVYWSQTFEFQVEDIIDKF